MPREAASSSAEPSGSSSSSSSASAPVAGPGPSTAAARTASSSTSATSSARSSPANDLFRISLPDSPDVGFGGGVHLDPVVDAVLRELTEEGRKRFQDMLEQASSDLKARLALLDSDDKKERKRLFDEFVHNMHEIALMQEHEVQAHVREEVLGKGSSGFSSASRSIASNATTSTFSTASTLSPTGTSSSSAQGSASSAGATASRVGPRISNTRSSTQNDDSSDSEEETDRPQPLPRNTKSDRKAVKSKSGKHPPSLNTAPTVNARNPTSNTSKKVTKDDDQSSSPSTPTPTQVRRGRSGTISLPHSVSASSTFPDDTLSSASLHAKSKSSENASAKQCTGNNAEIAKQKAKGSSKSATSSPLADSCPELVGVHGVSSASGATSSSAAGTARPTNVATKAIAAASQNQSQKLTQQRFVATAPQPPAPSRGNSSSNVNTAGAKKGNVQQTSVAAPSGSSAAIASPPQQSQTFQYAQAQIAMQSPPLGQARAQVPQSQPQIHSHAQAQLHSQPPKLAQDDPILGIRPKESGNPAQGVNHKLWIPPKPPHMQSPGQSAPLVHTVSSSSIAGTSVAMKDQKDAKDGTGSKDSKEKKPRPVSFASLSNVNLNDTADGSAKNSPASTARTLEKGDRKVSDEHDAKVDRKGDNTSGSVGITSAPTASTPEKPTLATALHSSETSSSNSTETAKGTQPSGTPASPKGKDVEVIKNCTSSPKAAVSFPPLSNGETNAASASIPSTPLILTSGLSSASSSEAATADMERERLRAEKVLRAEKAYLLASQSVTINNGKTQLQSHRNVTQPHAHLHLPAYNPALQPQSHQKTVSAETINASYLHPYSLGYTTTNSSAPAGLMSPSTSGSTITSPFSPLSMTNGFPSSSAATSAASSRAISRHASSSSADPYAQKDNSAASHVHHAHGHHRENNKEKDKLAREAAAVLIAQPPPTQANMFWQPNPNEREREQRERERRDRNHLHSPSANDSSASASAASSRSNSVSRHDTLALSGFDPSTIRPTGRSAQAAQQNGSGGFNSSLDGAFSSYMGGGPNGLDRGASTASGNAGRSGHEAKIWMPGQAKDTTPKAARRGGRERDAGVSASSPPIDQLALTISSASTSTTSALVPLAASTASNASTPQAEFYAAAERAREERLRERSNEFRSRVEVISFFRRRFDALMGEFMEAMMQADDYEKFGPTSAVPKQGSL